jgi:hypothetical protein
VNSGNQNQRSRKSQTSAPTDYEGNNYLGIAGQSTGSSGLCAALKAEWKTLQEIKALQSEMIDELEVGKVGVGPRFR